MYHFILRILYLLSLLGSSASLQSSVANRNLSLFRYSSYWDKLLLTEYQEYAAELREQRKTWSKRRLEESGISVFDSTAEPDSEVLGEKIVRIYKQGETKFADKFSRGDVLLLTPLIPTVDQIPKECLVIDVGKDWMTLGVGPRWPNGLWESRRQPGFYKIQLDRSAPQAPLRAQRNALERLLKEGGLEAAGIMASLFESQDNNGEELTQQLPLRFDASAIENDILEAIESIKQQTTFRPNQSQKEAISWALQRQVSLIRGPPGTGKTRVAALLIAVALRLPHLENTPKQRVLAVTHSNGAADVLLEALLQMGVPAVRLGRPASVSPNVHHRTIIAMSEKMPNVIKLRRESTDNSLDSQIRSAAAFELQQALLDVQRTIAKTAPVVVTTCIGANQLLDDDAYYDDECGKSTFPLVVLDEAAQTTEPALICALVAARAEQLILVGDTRQLPPTILSMPLRNTLGVSPMARLEKCGIQETTLSVQYRMPPILLEHPSNYFYGGNVKCAPQLLSEKRQPPLGFPWPSSEKPLAFVETGTSAAGSEVAHNFGSRSNPDEAQILSKIVSMLIEVGKVKGKSIAVISPYSKQVQLIRSELAHSNYDVRVGTVDSFQGQETDIVVFSAVRSNPLGEMGFLRDSRRLCVSITRARKGLIIVGDKRTLRSCHHWEALINFCESKNCLMCATDLTTCRPASRVTTNKQMVQSNQTSAEISFSNIFGEKNKFYGLFSEEEDEFDGLFKNN